MKRKNLRKIAKVFRLTIKEMVEGIMDEAPFDDSLADAAVDNANDALHERLAKFLRTKTRRAKGL